MVVVVVRSEETIRLKFDDRTCINHYPSRLHCRWWRCASGREGREGEESTVPSKRCYGRFVSFSVWVRTFRERSRFDIGRDWASFRSQSGGLRHERSRGPDFDRLLLWTCTRKENDPKGDV